jgi:hypothetical protein
MGEKKLQGRKEEAWEKRRGREAKKRQQGGSTDKRRVYRKRRDSSKRTQVKEVKDDSPRIPRCNPFRLN